MCDLNSCLTLLHNNQSRIQSEFGVTSMAMFGSVARGQNRPDSDVDIIVDMPPKIFLVSALKDFLENLLDTSVDIIRRHSHLSPEFTKQIDRDAVTIF